MLSSLLGRIAGPTHFKSPLLECPAPPASYSVPSHVRKPDYAIDKYARNFAIYDGPPRLHTPEQVQRVKVASTKVSRVLSLVQNHLKQSARGITLVDLDQLIFREIVKQEGYPSPLGFYGFPRCAYLSLNQCLVQGAASERALHPGDKIHIDVGIYYNGMHAGSSLTHIFHQQCYQHTYQVKRLAALAQSALYRAIQQCHPGAKYSAIGFAVEQFALQNGVHVCEHFTGHGIGRLYHMPPMIDNIERESELVMQPGHIFTVEPVLTLHPTRGRLRIWGDGTTFLSPDNPNGQFGHTLLITDHGCEVLTRREGELGE